MRRPPTFAWEAMSATPAITTGCDDECLIVEKDEKLFCILSDCRGASTAVLQLQGGGGEECKHKLRFLDQEIRTAQTIKFQRVRFYGWFLDHANVARRSLLMGDKV